MPMTPSSIDSGSDQTERTGSRKIHRKGQDLSHMPPDLTEAQVSNAEKAEKVIARNEKEIQQHRFRQKPKRNRNPQ